MKVFILILSSLILVGCGATATRPVIKDLEDDKAIIQFQLPFGAEPPSQYEMNEAAALGCNLHGKKAQWISYHCRKTDPSNSFSPEICEALYACFKE